MAKTSLFIFRRDLRLHDNTALIESLSDSESVMPCFIFDDRQRNHPYFSENAFSFMIESLSDLDKELKKAGGRLYIFKGSPEDIIRSLRTKIQSVYINRDYTPFSIDRDMNISEACSRNSIGLKSSSDYLLTEPEAVTKDDGKPYTVFTPFYRRASRIPVSSPRNNTYRNYCTEKFDFEAQLPSVKENPEIFAKGGRSQGLNILKRISSYSRDIPSEKTSGLSPHNKFGTLSIREVFHRFLEVSDELVRELYWRDFFTHIAFNFPRVFGRSFREKYDKIKWSVDLGSFKRWCNGETGFPIVDAGMRQLNNTGWMHNRIRMITASFLVKDLHIDWRWGERYFASKLIDYDPSVNNGNWQWAASTGCDSQPYFRIFNPWMQAERFDPHCRYIKKWIPELKDVSAKDILKAYEKGLKGYPRPMVDHKAEKDKSIAIFRIAQSMP